MKRLRRLRKWLIRGVAAVSLLMALGTAAMWVRSYWCLDWVSYTVHQGADGNYDLSTSCRAAQVEGQLQFEWVRDFSILGRDLGPNEWYRNYQTIGPGGLISLNGRNQGQFDLYVRSNRAWHGFAFGAQTPKVSGDEPIEHVYFVSLPHWFLLAVGLLLPAYALLKAISGRRYAAGHCQVCGYDLRATPERCPECGTVPL